MWTSPAGEEGVGPQPGQPGQPVTARPRDSDRPGPVRAFKHLSVFLCKFVFYGVFVWARRALNRQKRRFLARSGRGVLAIPTDPLSSAGLLTQAGWVGRQRVANISHVTPV
jgi:hypothetical protein